MSEEEIITKRGTFGKVQVTLPIHAKNIMLAWLKRSGMGKAEFFRVALMIGAAQLAENVQVKRPGDSYGQEGMIGIQAIPARQEEVSLECE